MNVESMAKHLIRTLEEALKSVGADSVEGFIARGKIFECAGLLEPAVESYQTAAYAKSSLALARLALCHLKARNVEKGLDAAVKLVSIDKNFKVEFLATNEYCSTMSILGDALLASGREDAAVAAYRAALDADCKEDYAAGRLAHLLLARGEVDEATKLEKVIGDNPRFVDVRTLLSLASTTPAALPSVTVEQVRNLVLVAMPGRPLLIDGHPRVAERASDAHWKADISVCTANMLPAERERVGAAWEEAGRTEHASVASFARFILQLMALGAPAELVADASRALHEEIEHARLSLGIAGAFLGRPVSVGALDLSGLQLEASAEALLRSTILEGCMGETIASLQAQEASMRAEDGVLHSVLARIAQEENSHAELAWRAVEWLIETRPELARMAREIFEAAEMPEPSSARDDKETLSKYGPLSEHERREVAGHALREVIRPRSEMLLPPPATERRQTAARLRASAMMSL